MGSLRVTAGELRGRKISVPPDDVRPTSERARQAFFNIVADRVPGCSFLDLFAGSGIFSFEALSRGAKRAVAIEQSRRSAEGIERHAAEWNVPVTVVAADVFAGMKRLRGSVFDLVYADPPYDFARYDELSSVLEAHVALSQGAIVGVEHRRNTNPIPDHGKALRVIRRAEYGEVWITLLRNGAE
jgi:16S rRNA (guanine966-N2)-methyltransferase